MVPTQNFFTKVLEVMQVGGSPLAEQPFGSAETRRRLHTQGALRASSFCVPLSIQRAPLTTCPACLCRTRPWRCA
jgi:hypothetical protein